jgi:dihydroflavonol-4-reductase
MTVLVTGGSGYVAGWCIAALLDRGAAVRTTVRDLAHGSRLQARFGERLEVAQADLLRDDGWAEATKGCDRVLHVASPMGRATDGSDLIRPAREGTLRVLRAAVDAGVPRVVLTSSCAAATPPPGADGEFDEHLWTDPDQPGLDTYRRSKAIAERAAWDFMAEHGGSTTLTTVLPGAVLGPVQSTDNLGSVQVIGGMLRGSSAPPRGRSPGAPSRTPRCG